MSYNGLKTALLEGVEKAAIGDFESACERALRVRDMLASDIGGLSEVLLYIDPLTAHKDPNLNRYGKLLSSCLAQD